MNITAPTRFVGLHSHTTHGSVFDAIGTAADHINFAMSNGADALALTDHGNMCGYSHQMAHLAKLKKKDIQFKGLFGMEAYYIPSLKDWALLKEQSKTPVIVAEPGDELASAKHELQEMSDAKSDESEEEDGGTIVENEEESKSGAKGKNPLKQRNHLVLLAKNSEGLQALFNIASDAAADGSYMGYPRVDMDILRKHAKGNIVGLSACIAGAMAKIVFDHQTTPDWKLWVPNNDNQELIQSELAKAITEFQEALGPENYYLELQFNKLGAQHLVNQHLIEASKRLGVPLVATCDAHYSDPSHWREREIYKAIGWGMKGGKAEALPESVAELKCELYPKNAQQMWDTYLATTKEYGFYDPQVVKEAIERTHEIAHQQIGKVEPDRAVKLPALNKLVPENDLIRIRKVLGEEGKDTDDESVAFRELRELAVAGLKWRKKTTDEYISRLKVELDTIRHLKLSRYFLTYYWIMKVVSEKQLIGNARGCFLPRTVVKMSNGAMKPIESIQVGECVVDAYGNEENVVDTLVYDCKEEIVELEFEDGRTLRCTKNHKFLTNNRGWVEAQNLTDEDDVKEV